MPVLPSPLQLRVQYEQLWARLDEVWCQMENQTGVGPAVEAELEAAAHAQRLLLGAAFYGEETTVNTHDFLNFVRRYLEFRPPARLLPASCTPLQRACSAPPPRPKSG